MCLHIKIITIIGIGMYILYLKIIRCKARTGDAFKKISFRFFINIKLIVKLVNKSRDC